MKNHEENQATTVTPEETAQAAENTGVENKSMVTSFGFNADDDWAGIPSATSPPTSQSVIAVKTTTAQEDVLNAKYHNSAIVVADTVQHMALAAQNIVNFIQNINDSSLSVADSYKEFYKRHTLQPEQPASAPQ